MRPLGTAREAVKVSGEQERASPGQGCQDARVPTILWFMTWGVPKVGPAGPIITNRFLSNFRILDLVLKHVIKIAFSAGAGVLA